MKAKPFVTWAGGKTKLLDHLLPLFPEKIPIYYEPFIGGGAVFFALHEGIDHAILTDINPELITAYQVVRDDPESLILELSLLQAAFHRQGEEYYYEIRDKAPGLPLHIAARFMFLNRTCFNGLWRVNKSGKFNLPFGKKPRDTKICHPDTILAASEALQKASFKVLPYGDVDPVPGSFMFIDPPYLGTHDSYTIEGFNQDDHYWLHFTVQAWNNRDVQMVVTQGDHPYIRELYGDPHDQTAKPYTAGGYKERRKTANQLIYWYPQ